MKIGHWTGSQNSGLTRMARSIVAAEQALGIDSWLIPLDTKANVDIASFDVHVAHTHLPEEALYSGKPMVWIAHATPEVMFHAGYEEGTISGAYGHGDPWMLAQFWLQRCDRIVTFWPRHQKIWQSMVDKGRTVDCIPMGVDTNFWRPWVSDGAYTGKPSVFTAENCYEMKWPLDLFIAWPWVVAHPELHLAKLHAIYVPKDQHRWWFPLVNRNGASFASYISPRVFDDNRLRNAFCSTDFYIGLVRYGDFNRTCLEASASGASVISWAGNPYADFWLTEGDQRVMADELTEILLGAKQPRIKEPVPNISETAFAMSKIYEELL